MTNKKQTILAIECAAGSVSTCVYAGDILSEQYADIPYSHVTELMPMVDSVVNISGLKKADIDAVAVSTGPGFFTGLRIGLATANGLAMGLDVPLYGISTLQAFAHQVNVQGKVLILLETKRADFYGQVFDGVDAVSGILVLNEEEITLLIATVQYVVGSGLKRFLKNNTIGDTVTMLNTFDFPTASSVAVAVEHALASGVKLSSEPLYLRSPDVGKKKTPKA